MPGYSTNVALTESGMYLRVGLKNKFINGTTCLDKINDLSKKYKNGDFRRAIEDEFVRRSIMASYGNHRVYVVDEINFDLNVKNKTITIKDKEGLRQVNLMEYFQLQYNKTVTQVDQPLFVSYRKSPLGEKEPVYLVPELFYITGLDEELRSQEPLKKNMTSRTKVTPKERLDRIYQFKQLIYKQYSQKRTVKSKTTDEDVTLPDPNDIRERWGLNIGDFQQFTGRVLEDPEIRFQNEVSKVDNGKFRGRKFVTQNSINNWVVISSEGNKRTAEDMVRQLRTASGNLGVDIQEPNFLSHSIRYPEEIVDFLRSRNLRARIILFILDRGTKHHYGPLKKFCYTELGYPSQVMLRENSSKNLSYYSNVLSQMVAKMGGTLYQIPLDTNLNSTVRKTK